MACQFSPGPPTTCGFPMCCDDGYSHGVGGVPPSPTSRLVSISMFFKGFDVSQVLMVFSAPEVFSLYKYCFGGGIKMPFRTIQITPYKFTDTDSALCYSLEPRPAE